MLISNSNLIHLLSQSFFTLVRSLHRYHRWWRRLLIKQRCVLSDACIWRGWLLGQRGRRHVRYWRPGFKHELHPRSEVHQWWPLVGSPAHLTTRSELPGRRPGPRRCSGGGAVHPFPPWSRLKAQPSKVVLSHVGDSGRCRGRSATCSATLLCEFELSYEKAVARLCSAQLTLSPPPS